MSENATIDRFRLNEAVSQIAFGGRRRRVYRRIVELSGVQPGDRVLDIGSSSGYLARQLAAAVGRDGAVTGVDPSRAAIEHARRHAPANLTFVVGVAEELSGIPDESIDVVTSTLAVHHFPAGQRAAAFAEMFRVTRPGGRLLVADFRASGRRVSLHARGMAMRHDVLPPLEDLVTTAGFRIETTGELPLLRYVAASRPAPN
jgi:ubiquinone/menaquinone biosynthesis C-methylase UbiE